MSTFANTLRDEYERSLARDERTGASAALSGAIPAIRRRRAVRAASASVTSVAAVGAVAFAGVHLSRAQTDDGREPATPAWEVGPDGRPEWCDLSTYPLPNPEAIPHTGFVGRQYVDYRGDSLEVTWVTPEGEVIHGFPDSDGDVFISSRGTMPSAMFVQGMYLVSDTFGNGSGGSDIRSDGPALGYEWTTVVPEETPPGVDRLALLQAHTLTIGFGGSGLPAAAVPDGATIETVFRWVDGREQRVELRRDDAGASLRDHSGLASAAIVVTGLPDGGAYEIVSYYDESLTYEAACGVELVDPPQPDRSRDADYLEGPEAAVFRCGAQLPEALEGAWRPVLRFERDSVYDESDALWYDYGSFGVTITVELGSYPFDVESGPSSPGWFRSWDADAQSPQGTLLYATVAWIDEDGVLVAHKSSGDSEAGDNVTPTRPGMGGSGILSSGGGAHGSWTTTFGSVDVVGSPCADVDSSRLAGAVPVLLLGQGGSTESMEWSWIRLDGEAD